MSDLSDQMPRLQLGDDSSTILFDTPSYPRTLEEWIDGEVEFLRKNGKTRFGKEKTNAYNDFKDAIQKLRKRIQESDSGEADLMESDLLESDSGESDSMESDQRESDSTSEANSAYATLQADVRELFSRLGLLIQELPKILLARPISDPPPWLAAALGVILAQMTTKPTKQMRSLNPPYLTLETVRHTLSKMTAPPTSLEELLTAALNSLSPLNGITSVEDARIHLTKDFQGRYQGKEVDRLHERLVQGISTSKAHVMPIIQSSGVGKSRAVMELLGYSPGIITCVRPNSSDPDSLQSLPPQDPMVHEFLMKVHEGASEGSWLPLVTVAGFLRATLEVLIQEIRRALPDVAEEDVLADAEWKLVSSTLSLIFGTGAVMIEETGDLRIRREGCLREIISRAKEHVEKETSLRHERLSQSGKRQNQEGTKKRQTVDDAEHLGAQAKPELTQLRKWAGQRRYVFLAIDEVMTVFKLIPVFRRVVSYYKVHVLWLLVLGTNNAISNLSGAIGKLPSGRTHNRAKALAPPFHPTTFDVLLHDNGHLTSSYYDMLDKKSAPSYEFLMQILPLMGRPLWNDSQYKYLSAEDPAMGIGGIKLGHVLIKVLGDTSIRDLLAGHALGQIPKSNLLEERPGQQILALVAQRLPLELPGMQGVVESEGFLASQITHYLRTVTAIDIDTPPYYVVHSYAPSEPILSLAIAHHIRSLDRPARFWDVAIQAIGYRRRLVHLTIGENGEDYVRILLTMAMDFAAIRKAPVFKTHLVNLVDWLNMLFWRKATGDTLNSENSELQAEIKARFTNGWLNFTHFYRLVEQFSSPKRRLPHSSLVEAWSRQAAILGISNQPTFDILIPIYFSAKKPTVSDGFDPHRIAPLSIQIKNSVSCTDRPGFWNRDWGASVQPSSNLEVKGFSLFLNLQRESALDHRINNRTGHLTIYVGGHSTSEHKVLTRLDAHTRDVMEYFLGSDRSANVPESEQNPRKGTDAYRVYAAKKHGFPAYNTANRPIGTSKIAEIEGKGGTEEAEHLEDTDAAMGTEETTAAADTTEMPETEEGLAEMNRAAERYASHVAAIAAGIDVDERDLILDSEEFEEYEGHYLTRSRLRQITEKQAKSK